MRIIFMGNAAFAVPALQRIANSEIEVAAVITNMPKRGGRGQKIRDMPVAIQARPLKIPVLQPSNLTDQNFIDRIKNINAAALVVIAFPISLSDSPFQIVGILYTCATFGLGKWFTTISSIAKCNGIFFD